MPKRANGLSATEIINIANNEFDADRVDVKSLTGWEHSDSVGGAAGGNVKAKRFHGNYAAKHSADTDYTARMKQTIKDLPDGTYTLRASVMSSGGTGMKLCALRKLGK